MIRLLKLLPSRGGCIAAAALAWPVVTFGPSISAAPASQPVLVPKWGRFEQVFKSSAVYANPPMETSLAVEFVSPLNETNQAAGFWDGGETWRVRFSPDLPGKWKFRSVCSDATNSGLNNVTGEFLCTAAGARTPFEKHGPVQVARDHRHLEYSDQTPFFWMGDTVWQGALHSKLRDWFDYGRKRVSQKFTVAQWMAWPGTNSHDLSAFSDEKRLLIDPDYFKELDARMEIFERVGLLNAIAPMYVTASRGINEFDALTDEQAVMLLRYMQARWSANNIVWILTCEDDTTGRKARRWKRLGRQVFGRTRHAPVIVFPGSTYWALDEFRPEAWVDVLSYQSSSASTDDSLQWTLFGPVSTDWRRAPIHPMLNLATPCETLLAGQPDDASAGRTVRRALYWSLLNSPTAGVSYGAASVWNWRDDAGAAADGDSPGMNSWQAALELPGAQQVARLVDFFVSLDFWQLRPAPSLVASQPGMKSPSHYIAAARSESQDFAVIYTPEERAVDLNPAELPVSPVSTWVNPLTGERSPAQAIVKGASCRYLTPGPGDWLLLIVAGK